MANAQQAVFLAGLVAVTYYHGTLFLILKSAMAMFFGLMAILVLKQNDILYIPHPDPSLPRGNLDNPRGFGDMPYEDVYLVVEGEKAHAWLIKQSEDDVEKNRSVPTMIYFHGNAGNISNRLPYYEAIWKELGINILAVDYRGYGESEGSPSEDGIKADAMAFYKFALNNDHIDPQKLVVFGRSLGGAVGLDLAAETDGIKALIIENTFLSVADIAFVLYPFLRVVSPFMTKPLLSNTWLSKDKISKISCPILFISGEKDELIPPEHMRELYRLCRHVHGTSFCSVPNGSHNDTPIRGGAQYYAFLRNFLHGIQHGFPDEHLHVATRRATNFSESSFTDDEDVPMFS